MSSVAFRKGTCSVSESHINHPGLHLGLIRYECCRISWATCSLASSSSERNRAVYLFLLSP